MTPGVQSHDAPLAGDPRASLVLYNANVATFAEARPHAEIVAIRGERILAVGMRDDVDDFVRPGTELVDCAGATVIPGFNDAHCHPVALAIGLLGVDCSPAATPHIAEIQQRIRARAEQTPAGQWIRATGCDEAHLAERRLPTRAELDQAAPCHPVVLVHATGQSCVLNGAALRLADVAESLADASERGVERDPRSGEPTGLVSGRQDRLARAIPAPDPGEIERGMALADREYLRVGITSLQDASWTNGWRHWETWQRLVSRAVVSPRVSMMVGTESLDRFFAAGLVTGSGDARLRIGAFKLALDESTGRAHPPQDEVNDLALRAHQAGYQVAFHVSDVPALEAALEAIAFVRRRSAREAPGFRLEHCAVCPPHLLAPLAASRAIVVTQPAFLRGFGGRYLDAAAPHQAGWFCPLAAWRRRGIPVASSSDSPLVGADPLAGIEAAVRRTTDDGRRLDPRQGIAARDALEMYTFGGAQASLEAASKGSIEPGKLADLVLLDRDPTALAPEELSSVRVVRTIIGGRTVWAA